MIRPVRGLVPAMGDAYFDVHVPDSPAYRVSVASFDFVELREGSSRSPGRPQGGA